jgi:hypothetical protein
LIFNELTICVGFFRGLVVHLIDRHNAAIAAFNDVIEANNWGATVTLKALTKALRVEF